MPAFIPTANAPFEAPKGASNKARKEVRSADARLDPKPHPKPDPKADRSPDPRDDILQHIPALRAFALSLCRNPDRADDLVQDTLVRAWSHFGSFAPGSHLRSWLFTILRNGFYSDLRKTRREVPDHEGAFVARLVVGPSHDCALAMTEFLRAFARLSPEHREVLALVGALGFSYEEAAKVTQLAVGTVKSRVSRARSLLGENPLPMRDRTTLAILNRSTSGEPARAMAAL